MTIKNDKWILEKCTGETPMIEPFNREQTADGVISYGVSSYGYDLRVSDEVEIFVPDPAVEAINPKKFDSRCLRPAPLSISDDGPYIEIPANSFALARSVEYFRIPDNVMAVVQGKSTYARCGLVCQVTPLEPGWEGHVTLELSNTTPLPIQVFVYEGLCQVLFFEGERPALSYADRKGKYQGQTGITYPRVKGEE